MPAGTDGELGFDLGGVQWVVLCDQEGLEGGPIHKQRHSGELDIQHIVMPLFVTSLRRTRQRELRTVRWTENSTPTLSEISRNAIIL